MFAQIIVSVVMMIISAALQAAMAPKPEAPKPGKLDVPVADEGRNNRVAFGTNIDKSANIIWYGDARTKAIKKRGGKK